MNKVYHSQSLEDCSHELITDSSTGLSLPDIQKRQEQYGLNEIQTVSPIAPWQIFFGQFQDFLIIILFIASIVSLFMGEIVDGIVIILIVFFNGIVGFIQEYKAEKSLEALKSLESPRARVLRDGKEDTLEAKELVPGDIIILTEGDRVPADARLFLASHCTVDESLLTGESVPNRKSTHEVPEVTPLAERSCMVYSGTLIVTGSAKAIVVATAMQTEMGKIATLVQEQKEIETPLQKKLTVFAKKLGIISIGLAIPGVILGIIQGRDIFELFLTGVSLVVSAVPEGLPIVITIALALGVKRMVHVHALIRRLPVVEVLGGADVICTDKTGTLTCNQMTVQEVITADAFYAVTGEGYEDVGEYYKAPVALFERHPHRITDSPERLVSPLALTGESSLQSIIEAMVLCNDATLTLGDPTERALLVAARKGGVNETLLRSARNRLADIPFSSERKYMASLHAFDQDVKGYIKGATEVVLRLCSTFGEQEQALTPQVHEQILATTESMAKTGLRVLALASSLNASKAMMDEENPSGFTFLGLVGMIDPPRDEVKEAIHVCKRAGIRVIMITGDHPATAEAIGTRIGIDGSTMITGTDLDALDDESTRNVVEKTSIFARVSSEHKLKILKALQANGHIAAMTGDGVNDAPAIKRADIGISVGSGTDLTKEVSDMILLNDNFATFEKAILEGRAIYANIQNFVKFLLSANFGEVLIVLTTIFLSVFIGRNVPIMLLPIHILWLNLLSDGLPALALSIDKPLGDVMKKPPRNPKDGILQGMLLFTFTAGVVAFLTTIGLFSYFYPWWQQGLSTEMLDKARTIAFCQTVFFELFFVFTCRSERGAFAAGIFSNIWLIIAVVVSLGLQVLIVMVPFFHQIFKTVSLSFTDWGLMIGAALISVVIMEIFLFLERQFPKKNIA